MISAVVFDLYGTLVGAPPVDSYAAYAAGTATRLGFDPLKFPPIYDADYEGRQTGRFGTHEQYLRDLAQRLGVRLSESQLTALVQFRVDTVRSWLIVKPDAVSTLRSLRARASAGPGLRLRMGDRPDLAFPVGRSAHRRPGAVLRGRRQEAEPSNLRDRSGTPRGPARPVPVRRGWGKRRARRCTPGRHGPHHDRRPEGRSRPPAWLRSLVRAQDRLSGRAAVAQGARSPRRLEEHSRCPQSRSTVCGTGHCAPGASAAAAEVVG